MGMSPAQKAEEVAALHARFASDEIVVLTHNLGLSVAQVTALRRALRTEGASFKVTKNTLARRALKDTPFESLEGHFKGPTGVATSKDPVAAARVTYEFAKKNEKLVILGGALGSRVLDRNGIEMLAKLPSLDALRSRILGLIQAPATKVAGVLQAPAQQMVLVTKAYGQKDA